MMSFPFHWSAREVARSVALAVFVGGDAVAQAPRVALASLDSNATVVPAATGVVSFVFGRSDPLLSCTVLRVCIVELQPGEILVDEPIAGDQARWIITRAKTGSGGASTLVIVKPKACDISTNLILSTDRRIYDLDLDSPVCKAGSMNPKRQYTRRIRFEYPNDVTRVSSSAGSVSDGEESAVAPSGARTRHDQQGDASAPSGTMNRDYHIVRGRRGPFGIFGHKPVDFPWMPSAIADDGSHVFITLPPEAKRYSAPVLYALESDGSRTMLNFTMSDSVIVTDRVFKRGLFVIAAGNTEQQLEFDNRSWGMAAASERRQ
jgi:type IV secretion system protein VirB9